MKKILFDWNGTLLDDLDYTFQTVTKVQQSYDIKPLADVEAYKSVFGFPIKDYYERAGFDFSKIDWDECGHRFMDAYVNGFNKTRLNPQAVMVLRQAKEANVGCYILSATKLDLLKAQVESFPELNGLIDGVYGIGDIFASSKAGAAREFLSTCLCWDEIYMVGDTEHDLECANKIGARCILYDGGHQSRQILEKHHAAIVSSLLEAWECINAGSHH